jgi:predicted ABC-type ATPase
MSEHPSVYVIAGPNGAGKTTFAAKFLPRYADKPAFINADTIARGLSGFSPDAVALKAGRLLLEQIEDYAAKRVNFAFETTLSGTTYLARLRKLQQEGYAIHIFFLWVPDIRLALARVANRVKMGGHAIPETVVRRRFHKGITNFLKHYRTIADSWMLFDNSGDSPYLVVEKEAGKVKAYDSGRYSQIMALAEGL